MTPRSLYTCISFFLLCNFSLGQNDSIFDLIAIDENQIQDTLAKNIAGISEIKLKVDSFILNQRLEDRLLCSFDSLSFDGNLALAHIYRGNIINENYHFDKNSLSKFESLNLIPKDSIISREYLDLIISKYSELGFPFARFIPSISNFNQDKLNHTLTFDMGPAIRYDSIHYKSESVIHNKTLNKYLDLQKDDPYNEKNIYQIEETLRDLNLYTISESPQVVFHQDKADVYLFMEKKQSNLFNGIIGFQPNSVTDKITVTGDIQLSLNNNLNRTEKLNLQWKKIEEQTQELNLDVNWPYLFSTEIGIGGAFNLYKQDTSFIQLNTKLGLLYLFSPINKIELFYQKESGNKLSNSASLSDLEVNSYGISLDWIKLDNRLNPRKGYSIELTGRVGRKQIENSETENSNEVFDQFYYSQEVAYYLPFAKKFTCLLGADVNLSESDLIFENEFFRLGGTGDLRGFDQNSIRATTSALGNLEIRYLSDANTNFRVFYNQMWYERKAIPTDSSLQYFNDTPLGFGAGVSFKVNSGIFNFEYALGKEQNQDILLRNGKIHFEFISLF